MQIFVGLGREEGSDQIVICRVIDASVRDCWNGSVLMVRYVEDENFVQMMRERVSLGAMSGAVMKKGDWSNANAFYTVCRHWCWPCVMKSWETVFMVQVNTPEAGVTMSVKNNVQLQNRIYDI